MRQGRWNEIHLMMNLVEHGIDFPSTHLRSAVHEVANRQNKPICMVLNDQHFVWCATVFFGKTKLTELSTAECGRVERVTIVLKRCPITDCSQQATGAATRKVLSTRGFPAPREQERSPPQKLEYGTVLILSGDCWCLGCEHFTNQ